MKKHLSKISVIQATLIVIFCLFVASGFSQGLTVVTPVSNQTFKMPDPSTLQTAADAQAALTSAETAGKALLADAVAEKPTVTAEQNNYSQAEAGKNNYMASINSFSKNDVDPYKLDLNNYNTAGAKFMQLLTKHNNAVKANNALPAKDRKPATVTALTKEKMQVDSMATQLGKWKTRLDVAKTKLDVKNAALQKQQQKYTSSEEASVPKLKTCKTLLTSILNQLTSCAGYAGKCKGLLTTKFNAGSATAAGFFETAEYKGAVADISAELAGLRSF
jgi:hypothetical protein